MFASRLPIFASKGPVRAVPEVPGVSKVLNLGVVGTEDSDLAGDFLFQRFSLWQGRSLFPCSL